MKSITTLNIEEIFDKYRNIAIVGISDSPERPSNKVAKYLHNSGFNIYPVNPKFENILGIKCYPDLKSIDFKIDIVDIFRRPDHVPAITDMAIEIGAKVIWMQLGVVNKEAAKKAKQHGLQVVMDRCIKIEHQRMIK